MLALSFNIIDFCFFSCAFFPVNIGRWSDQTVTDTGLWLTISTFKERLLSRKENVSLEKKYIYTGGVAHVKESLECQLPATGYVL